MRSLSLRIYREQPRRSWRRIGAVARAGRPLLALCALLALVAVASCRQGSADQAAAPGEVIVFAAASLTEAFGELGSQFELENPGVTVVLNLAGSQQLTHQLSQGAPADVFASADEEQMAAAVEVGRVKPRAVQHFAGNELTLIFPVDNPAGLRTLSDLARPGQQLVLAAPEVPAGHYAELFLEAAAADPAYGPLFREGVLANVVSYEENVRAVLSKVRLGEADAGIVYRSDAPPRLADEIGQIEIPPELNVQATYAIAPLDDSENPAMARAFIDFVLSSAGQEILVDHGLKAISGE